MTTIPPAAANEAQPASAAPPRSRWQFSLRMILLLMAVVGVWTAEIVNRRQISWLGKQIATLEPMARTFAVENTQKIAVIKNEELWYDDNDWTVYLPAGQFRLCLATQEIDSQGIPAVRVSAPLPAGQFQLSLSQHKQDGGYRVRVLKDGVELLAAIEPAAWYPNFGSSGGGHFASCEQRIPSEPVVLFRRRFSQPIGSGSSQTPAGPCAGLMLWIEVVGK